MSIASEIARLQQAKADLKTAINAKGQSITDETLDEYAAFVDDIETGGGGGTGDYLVRFIDYDGTILKEEYVDSGEAATAPTSPDHTADGLTFVEWNNAYSNITHDLDVGATYETTDGKTHIFITLTAASGKTPTLYLNKSDASTLSVDWGDGSAVETFTNSGNFNTGAHTYTNYGDYVIKMWISSGSGTYGFGNGTSSTVLFNGYPNITIKVFVGDNVPEMTAYCLHYFLYLSFVMLPKTVNTIGSNWARSCACEFVCLPSSITSFPNSVFFQCFALKVVSYSMNLTAIGANAFSSCYALTKFYIPDGVTILGDRTFDSCYPLKKINIHNAIESIGVEVFEYCYSLEEPVIPNSVLTIGQLCFSYCSSLSEMTIPASITSVSIQLFQNCRSLKKVTFLGDLTAVGDRVFLSVTNIYQLDFTNCTTVPTCGVYLMPTIISTAKILVPSALEAAWKSATNWSVYADYIYGV